MFFSYISALILGEWLRDWAKWFIGNDDVNAKQIGTFIGFRLFSCSNGVTTLLQKPRKALEPEHIRQQNFMSVDGL